MPVRCMCSHCLPFPSLRAPKEAKVYRARRETKDTPDLRENLASPEKLVVLDLREDKENLETMVQW